MMMILNTPSSEPQRTGLTSLTFKLRPRTSSDPEAEAKTTAVLSSRKADLRSVG